MYHTFCPNYQKFKLGVCGSLSGSQGGYNKIPQMRGSATVTYCPMVLQIRSPKLRCQQDCFSLNLQGKILPGLSQLLVFAGSPWRSLPCRCVTPISAFLVTWPPSLCVSLFASFLISTSPYFIVYNEHPHFWPKLSGKKKSFVLVPFFFFFLKQQKFIVAQCWRLEACDQGVGRVGFFLRLLSLTCRQWSYPCVFPRLSSVIVCVLISFSGF